MIVWGRYAGSLVFLVPAALIFLKRGDFVPIKPGLQILRGLMIGGVDACFRRRCPISALCRRYRHPVLLSLYCHSNGTHHALGSAYLSSRGLRSLAGLQG